MGVYIKGLKKPQSCNGCFLTVPVFNYARNEYVNICPLENSTGCLLAEVSTPHGRLIDVDKLIPVLAAWITSEDDFQAVLDAVEQIPTVIERED